MFAKLFARITESSLMEEDIPVRYTFVLLVAIADPRGYVIGTDVAIARRLNMQLDEFERCRDALMKPDPDSNSKEHEGKRLINSDGERGYMVVNYVKYRDTKSEQHKRDYMRAYMRQKRHEADHVKSNGVNKSLQLAPLALLSHAEAEAEADRGKAPRFSTSSILNLKDKRQAAESEIARLKELREFNKATPDDMHELKRLKAFVGDCNRQIIQQ